jgi:hypothetical protein
MFINNIENNASKMVMERENSESRKEKQTNGVDVDNGLNQRLYIYGLQ